MLIEKRKYAVGQRCERWTVTGDAFLKGRHVFVPVRCDCGVERAILKQNLTNGQSRSCGCLMREEKAAQCYRHGMSRTPVYAVWSAMVDRCRNPENKKWADYGGRGITFAPEWTDFAAFYRDMGERPEGTAELDRIDNDGNYEPGNCRWTTRTVQCNNKRVCRYATHDGRTQTLTEWARELGIPDRTVHKWVLERGLTIQECVERRAAGWYGQRTNQPRAPL